MRRTLNWFAWSFVTSLSFAMVLFVSTCCQADDLGFRVPEGFRVSLFADDDLAHDIFSMTIDSHGRVVVAGRGYVKILHDTDEDGRADKATLFSSIPQSGAHGMYFDGDDLICTGDNSLMRLRDADGDGVADGKPEIWAELRHPEHGANGVIKGPDGWIYVICGNDAGVSDRHATTAGSPVKKPQSGAVLRFSPDGLQSEIVAHGFRNPYDLDFNAFGQLFTVDADGERDQYLPWYAPTRLFDIAQGMHHGWVLQGWQRSWNRPASYFDSVPRVVEIGRGSPTGLLVYRHTQFPEHYRGGVFSCCWTLGRVYHFPLKRAGSSYKSETEIFLETTGDTGFAPVDLAVGPKGDVFVAIGGRGTRGGVFRVTYNAANDDRAVAEEPRIAKPVLNVLNAPQPLASWSRAEWVPVALELGREPFERAAFSDFLTASQRIRAIELLTESFGGVREDVPSLSGRSQDREVIARYTWALGRMQPSEANERHLAELTYHDDARVRRAAWDGLATRSAVKDLMATDYEMLWRTDERIARASCWCAARALADEEFAKRYRQEELEPFRKPSLLLARNWWLYGQREFGQEAFADAIRAYIFASTEDAREPNELKLEAVRLMQIALGDIRVDETKPDVYAGYKANDLNRVSAESRRKAAVALSADFPTKDQELNREMARLLGMLEADADEALLEAIAGQFTISSRPEEVIHFLIVMSLLNGPRSEMVTKRTAKAIGFLHASMALREMYPSRNWPLRVGETFEELCKRDPKLASVLIQEATFRSPAQSLFALRMTGENRTAAARKLLRAAEAQYDEDAWTAEFVELIATLPKDESMPALRSQWQNYALRDTIALVLARDPQREDRGRFVDSLKSAQPQVIEQAANALRQLGGTSSPEETATALRILRQQCADRRFINSRRALSKLMQIWSGQTIEVKENDRTDVLAAYQPWFDWFTTRYPDQAEQLAGFAGADAAEWKTRLDAVDWNDGEAGRGKLVYERRSCHRCHSGESRLGPDLAGAAARFSREDLFAAIVEPNRDVSPLYQTSQLETDSGKVYQGLIVYESPEGTLIQTSADTTVRIAGEQIVSIRPSRQSLMPAGLLNEVNDQELADLYAYLKSLKH